MTARLRLRFWLLVLDFIAGLPRSGVAHELYLWAVRKASDCVDWSAP